tara:strand:+ start:1824 stop:2399 length:576 start_codon:yes stop_codon:yes gene_type:complete
MRVELVIPNEWKDITIQQFQEFEENISSDKNKTEKLINSISILCNVETRIIKKLKTKDLQEIAVEINKLEQKRPLQFELQKIIEYKGFKYGLIPNMSEMTTGEFIDLESWASDSKAMKNLHRIMSILYRPIVGSINMAGQYNIESYEPTIEKENLMLDLPMDIALGCVNFFFLSGGQLIKSLHSSSNKQKK